MITTRNYNDSFIEIKADETETICYTKEQARDLALTLQDAVNELIEFIMAQK